MPPHIIAIGEALVEIMRPDTSSPLDEVGEFRGPFASGAPAIFAVAMARLGESVGFISGVGQDAFGRLLRKRLTHENVDSTELQTIPDRTTGIAFVAYASNGSREFVFHLRDSAAGAMDAEQIQPDYFSGSGWLHLSGTTIALNPQSNETCWRALELAKSAGRKISFDPNLRAELMSVEEAIEVYTPFIEAADLLLPTLEEAYLLTGIPDADEAAAQLLQNPKTILALKRGAEGCTIYRQDERIDSPAYSVNVLDPTGAGDCFNAACIIGLDAGWPLERVARFACAAGALAVTRLGPMEGSPTLDEVNGLMKKE